MKNLWLILDDDDTASNSTINFKDADIDDSMILEIVAELDDTLEEEEQLAKAKEKLAKRLLKKKAQSFQKMIKSKPSLQPPVDVEPPKPDIDRRQSDRNQMMYQLPYPGA